MKQSVVTRARYERTHAFTLVQRQIRHLIDTPAKWNLRGEPVTGDEAMTCLQSWSPFWSDVLKDRVRDLVRAGRTLAAIEGGSSGEVSW